MNPMDLSGKRILITGASSGIGRQTAITCSQLGATVVMIARREDMLQETLTMMEGEGHAYYVLDLSEVEELEGRIKEICEAQGVFDGFVHCAGIGNQRPLRQTKYKNILEVMNTNFYSFVELVRCLSSKKTFVDGGSVIAISSYGSIHGDKTKTMYCSSKAAIDAAIRCMALELGERGIRVNSIQPGWVATEMYTRYLEKNRENSNVIDNVYEHRILPITEVYEVSNTAAFLLSDATKTITGTSILIDGGMMQA